ncbi:hypothetical protein CEXT_691281 [Caerostris extrusa]|uniref:Uncharacterized protein n=1 Tax=Caerostris extrusa TaxID=172846 RepID=A0AAV4XFQ0_CAEEX|nr:hypothetical protein CEXT_691281 [Caerostris extrusa]
MAVNRLTITPWNQTSHHGIEPRQPALNVNRLATLVISALLIRSPAAELQEHVQAEAPAGQVAGGGGQHHGLPDLHRQDRRPGTQAKEEDQHRGVCERGPREPLPQAAQALCAGDSGTGGQSAAREGGGQGVVLQPAAEGEEDDPSRQHRRGAGNPGGDDDHAQSAGARVPPFAQPSHAVAPEPRPPSAHARSVSRGPLTNSPLFRPAHHRTSSPPLRLIAVHGP